MPLQEVCLDMGLSSGISSHLQEEQARFCHLAHGTSELVRPLASSSATTLRCELLQDGGYVHSLATER